MTEQELDMERIKRPHNPKLNRMNAQIKACKNAEARLRNYVVDAQHTECRNWLQEQRRKLEAERDEFEEALR